jgi:ElaB/YqjD/DUF883 family membrane-anchored ribosome-binding protein
MKHNKNHDNVRSAGPQLVPVRFEFTHPTATIVCVAGTFNQWQPEAKTLHPAGGSLVEGNGFGARHLRILPGGGRSMDTGSAGEALCAQPVWREKLGSEGGELAGSSPSRRRGKFTTEKRKQPDNRENMNKQTQAISNDMGTLAEDARALMAATAEVAGEKVGEARKRLAAALESAKEIADRIARSANVDNQLEVTLTTSRN